MTSRYTKLAQLKNDKRHASSGEIRDADSLSEDMVFVMIFSVDHCNFRTIWKFLLSAHV